jgi:hypothetical protein
VIGLIRSQVESGRLPPSSHARPTDYGRGVFLLIMQWAFGAQGGAAHMTQIEPGTDRRALAEARTVARERYGGTKLGSAFFGWLVAVGLTLLLAMVAGAVSLVVGADVLVAGPAVSLAVLLVASFVGGYVAGRLARFDGARNGFLSWAIGLLVTAALAVVAAFLGARDGVLGGVPLPSVVTGLEQVGLPELVLVTVAVLGTLVAAVIGGKAGERFHRRVDRAAADAL